MAYTFTGGGSDKIDVGAAALTSNNTTGTMVALVYQTAQLPDRCMAGRGVTTNRLQMSSDDLYFKMEHGRSTTILRARATYANVPGYALNTWVWLAMSWNSAGVGTDQKLYGGNLTTPFVEVTTYNQQQIGSGTHDDSGTNLLIGNGQDAPTVSAWAGSIAEFAMFNRQLTLQELRLVQRVPVGLPSGCVLRLSLGIAGMRDLSGNGYNGTATGATQGAHPPMRIPRTHWPSRAAYLVAAAANPERAAYHYRAVSHLVGNP